MSAKSSVPAAAGRFCAALAFGAAVCAVCMGMCAAAMAKQGLAVSFVWPLGTFSACMGCFAGGWLCAMLQKQRGLVCGAALGLAFAAILLAAQGAAGSTPDYKQLLRLAVIALAGAAGGLVRTLAATKAKKRH